MKLTSRDCCPYLDDFESDYLPAVAAVASTGKRATSWDPLGPTDDEHINLSGEALTAEAGATSEVVEDLRPEGTLEDAQSHTTEWIAAYPKANIATYHTIEAFQYFAGPIDKIACFHNNCVSDVTDVDMFTRHFASWVEWEPFCMSSGVTRGTKVKELQPISPKSAVSILPDCAAVFSLCHGGPCDT